MALINCPECGKEISDIAQSCPNCGRPMQISPNLNNHNQNIQPGAKYTGYQQNLALQQRSNKKSIGCLITLLLFLCAIGILFTVIISVAGDAKENPDKYSSKITATYIDVTDEQGNAIDQILKQCGIENVKSFDHDELLDNAHFEGETGYRISITDDVKIIIYLNTDMSVYNIKYADYDLYSNNTVVATLQDYTLTTEEASDLQIKCQSKVEEILKSPSTAKFPNILEWGFKKEKNIVTVQGYVDAQNSFGAEMRSYFQFIIDTDSQTIQSLIFDGEELIK